MRLPRPLLLLTALTAPAAGAAQSAVTVELAASNAYVWRGVTNANQLVLDPTVTLDVPLRHGALSFGAWGNLEPRRADGPHDIGTLGGHSGPLLTQSQLWAEASGAHGALTFTGGVTRYFYPHVAGLSAAYGTMEVYGSVARDGLLAPSLSVWRDVQKVRGTYVEGAVGQDVPLGHGHALSLGAALGVSTGMRARDGQSSYFARDGVTHAELSATSELSGGSLAFSPTVHVVLASDPLARAAAADVQRTAKLWAGATVRWRRPLTRAALAAPRVVRPYLLPAVYSDDVGGDAEDGTGAARDGRSTR
jgi:hypothetical protein